MRIKDTNLTRIISTIFLVVAVVGFAYPLFAFNLGGTGFPNKITPGDSTNTWATTDANFVEGGHIQVPTFSALLGGTSPITGGNVVYITADRRRVGEFATVIDNTGGTGDGHNVVYQLISNPHYSSSCVGTPDPTPVTDASLDGKQASTGGACSVTTIANWKVVIPDVSSATAGLILQTDGSGNVVAVSSAGGITIGSLNGATGGTTKSANGSTIQSGVFYEQTADATYPGLVSVGTQTFTGSKTFSNPSVTVASGLYTPIAINTTYNEGAGTTSNSDLYVNRNETSVGSGAQRILDLNLNGSPVFSVDNKGAILGTYSGTNKNIFKIDPVGKFYGMGDLANSVNGSAFSIDDNRSIVSASQPNFFGSGQPGNIFVLNNSSSNNFHTYSMGLMSGYYSVAYGPTVTFTASSNTISKISGLSFISAGFQVGMSLVVTGSTFNNTTLTITAVSDNRMTVTGTIFDEVSPTTVVLYAQGDAHTEVNDSKNRIGLFGIPVAIKDYGLVSIGNDFNSFDGVSTDKFLGVSGGTELAVNGQTGFAGNLADFQIAGSSKFSVDASGNIANAGGIFDSFSSSLGTSGQVLSSTGTGTKWITSTGGIAGTGIANQIAYWNGTSSITGNTNFTYDVPASRLNLGFSAGNGNSLYIDDYLKTTVLGAKTTNRILTSSTLLLTSSTGTITTLGDNFNTQGFLPGDSIVISGTVNGNDGTYTIQSISANGSEMIMTTTLLGTSETGGTITMTVSGILGTQFSTDDSYGNLSMTNIVDGQFIVKQHNGLQTFNIDNFNNISQISPQGIARLSLDGAKGFYQMGNVTAPIASAPLSPFFSTGITFTAPNIIHDATMGGFVGFGFAPGKRLLVSGTASNDGIYYIVSVTGDTIIVREETLINEAPAGSVTLYGDPSFKYTTNSLLTLNDSGGDFKIENSYGTPLDVNSALGLYAIGDTQGNYNGTQLIVNDVNQSAGINTTDINTAFTVAQNKSQPAPVITQTVGSSDTLSTVTYTPIVSDTITITIDAIGGMADTYTWTDTLGGSSISPITITTGTQTVGNWGNYQFTFGLTTGHSVGDTWTIVTTNNTIYRGINSIGHSILTVASDGTTFINNDGPLGSMPVLSLDVANSRYGIGDVGTDPSTFVNFGTSVQIDDSSAQTINNYAKIYNVTDRSTFKNYLNINTTNTGIENGHYAIGDLSESTPYAGGSFAISDGNTTNWSASIGDATSSYLYIHPYSVSVGGSYYLGDFANSHHGNVVVVNDGLSGTDGAITNRISGIFQVQDNGSNKYLQTDITNNIYSIGDIGGIISNPTGFYMNGNTQLTGLNTVLPHATLDIHNAITTPGGTFLASALCTGVCVPHDGTTVSVDTSIYAGFVSDTTSITPVGYRMKGSTSGPVAVTDPVVSDTGFSGVINNISGIIYDIYYTGTAGDDFFGSHTFTVTSGPDSGSVINIISGTTDLFSWTDAGGTGTNELASPTLIGTTGHKLTVGFLEPLHHIFGDSYVISFTDSGPRIVNVENSTNSSIFNIDDNGSIFAHNNTGIIPNARTFAVDPTLGEYGIGDLDSSYGGTQIYIHDDVVGGGTGSIKNVIGDLGLLTVVDSSTGNKYLSIEPGFGGTGNYNFGDINSTSGIITDIEIQATGVTSTDLITLNGNALVNGNFTVAVGSGTCTIGTGATALVCSSDERLKKNIVDLGSTLDKINQLRPVTYNWIDPIQNQSTNIGFIAQDVQKIFPEFVSDTGNGYLGLNYAGLVVPAIEAIKELDIKIEPLTSLDITQPNTLGSLIKKYLEDALNGLAVVFTDKLQTNQLCLQDVCVTKVELTKLLNQANVSGASVTPVIPPAPINSTPVTPPVITPPPTTTDTTPTTTTPSSPPTTTDLTPVTTSVVIPPATTTTSTDPIPVTPPIITPTPVTSPPVNDTTTTTSTPVITP